MKYMAFLGSISIVLGRPSAGTHLLPPFSVSYASYTVNSAFILQYGACPDFIYSPPFCILRWLRCQQYFYYAVQSLDGLRPELIYFPPICILRRLRCQQYFNSAVQCLDGLRPDFIYSPPFCILRRLRCQQCFYSAVQCV